ncbi:MAG: FHA domain-containing protein [Thermoguttaceae bacterium]
MNASSIPTAPRILRRKLLPVELTIHDHYGRETQCVLHKLPSIIGRDEHADVPLIDPWISHKHCEISQIGNVLVVRDLDSKNGVFVHHHRVRESQVLSGERLTVGQTEIIVRYAGKAQTAIEAVASEPRKQRLSQNRAQDTAELLY